MNFLKDSWLTTIFTGNTTADDKISATTMNATKIVSFFVALFGGLTQVLKLTDVVKLSAGDMVTIWLTVGGLVVLLVIADMACRAYVTGKPAPARGETNLEQLQLGTIRVADEPGNNAGQRDAKLVGLIPGAKPWVHVRVSSNGQSFEEYVDPSRVHQ